MIEPEPEVATSGIEEALERTFREAISLRVPIAFAAPGELPRFELKAQRWVEVQA